MENALPNFGDLHLDSGTKKLILGLLNSIRSVVPVVHPPGTANPDGGDDKDLEGIRKTLLRSRQNSDELEGVFDPDVLCRYLRYASDYGDIIQQIETILNELNACRDSALNFACGLAELVEDHLALTEIRTGECSLKPEEFKLKVV